MPPRPLLGSYFSIEAAMSQVIMIVLALVMALILGMDQGLTRFFFLYGAGIGVGLLSVQLLRKIPGGKREVMAGGLYQPLGSRNIQRQRDPADSGRSAH
jgi:hypothetical protein